MSQPTAEAAENAVPAPGSYATMVVYEVVCEKRGTTYPFLYAKCMTCCQKVSCAGGCSGSEDFCLYLLNKACVCDERPHIRVETDDFSTDDALTGNDLLDGSEEDAPILDDGWYNHDEPMRDSDSWQNE